MKKFLLALSLAISACDGDLNEYGNVPADQETLYGQKYCLDGNPAGLVICDDHNTLQWQIKNSSDTAVHLTCEVASRAYVFIDKYYLVAGTVSQADSRNMAVGDDVTCSVWLGYFEGPLHRLFADKPDFKFEFIYARSPIIKLKGLEQWEVADLELTTLKGVSCELGVQYKIDDDKIVARENGAGLYCKNESSDWVDAQLYAMEAVTSPTGDGFEFAFQAAEMELYLDTEELADIKTTIKQGQVFSLVIGAHDWSYQNWTNEDVILFQVDLLGKKVNNLDENLISGQIP